MNASITKAIAIIAAIAVVVFLGAQYFLTRGAGSDDQFAQCRTSVIAGGIDQIGGPFTLVNAQGQAVTSEQVLTEPSLLYFGYTFCPDVCPLDNARNVETVQIMEDRGQMVTPIFISVDPNRDTPEVVGDFAANHHPRMIGLTGSPEQVKAASQAYRTYYKVQEAEDEYYLIDHSTFSYLVLPGHGFVEFFRRDVAPDVLADQIGCFLDNM